MPNSYSRLRQTSRGGAPDRRYANGTSRTSRQRAGDAKRRR